MQNVINHELTHIVEWLACNKLSLNINKSHFILFSSKSVSSDIKIYINGVLLKRVESTKFLGVYIDQKLTWKPHIQYIKGKIARSIGILTLARKYFNVDILVNLYYSFVYPLFYYNLEVWGSACPTHVACLNTLQKKCVRIITSSKYCMPSKPLFKRLEILPLSDLYISKVLLFMYKFNNSLLCPLFHNFFAVNKSNHRYNTRHGDHLRTPCVKTDLRKRTLRFTAVKIYNDFFSVLNFSERLPVFKRSIKKYFAKLLV